MITKISKRHLIGLSAIICQLTFSAMLTSCEDFFEQDADHIIYAEKDHLNNATDTIYSVIGVINKLQALGDRTILLGELRGDLVDLTDNASADLREIANFSADDDNVYNQPRDYYAVINNCNYFIANADTALRNNRDEYIFRKEYAAIKAYRAWTYLQLALNYGSVPFVTEPILTKQDAEAQYERRDLQSICNYFIQDLQPYVEVEFPGYRDIYSNDSRFFYFPIYVLLGELNLWAGNYREAALCYYKYIANRGGERGSYPSTSNSATWQSSNWSMSPRSNLMSNIVSESYENDNAEPITLIASDLLPSEGNYSQLYNLFCSNTDNNYKVSITPSRSIIDLSAAQRYALPMVNDATGEIDIVYAPSGLEKHRTGDLRLSESWNDDASNRVDNNGKALDSYQMIYKYATGMFGLRLANVHIWRRTMIYLHMAEALNRAGFPRFAFALLSTGVDSDVLNDDILPYYESDAAYLQQFRFPSTRYILCTARGNAGENTLGIHSRGSGWTPLNAYYQLPDDSTLEDNVRLDYQIDGVEKLIADEEALEFAFEGHRFYDLMRMALRRGDPAFLADRVYARRGKDNVGTMRGEIKKDLYNPQNWYLQWNGQIGVTPATAE